MKKQNKQLEKILFEVYDKGVKQEDCNLTECIENVNQALRIHDVSGQLPDLFRNFIRTHHLTSKWELYLKENEGNLR